MPPAPTRLQHTRVTASKDNRAADGCWPYGQGSQQSMQTPYAPYRLVCCISPAVLAASCRGAAGHSARAAKRTAAAQEQGGGMR
jgi:hypothetical protein